MGIINKFKKAVEPKRELTEPEEDFSIRDSWVLYENDDVDPKKRRLAYMCYQLEMIEPSTGERKTVYKAVKFVRVIRIPAEEKQSLTLMQRQAQILAALWGNEVNFVCVMANLIRPAEGLLFLYGVQGIADNIEDAKKEADKYFAALKATLQGNFRVLEMRKLNGVETEWLREKIATMNFMTVLTGIPEPQEGGEDAGNKGLGGRNLNPDSQGQIEEIIAAMVDYEYAIEVLVTPVFRPEVEATQFRIANKITDWSSQLQGMTSINANISIPMMNALSQGHSSGWSHNYTDSNNVAYSEGVNFSNSAGESLTNSLSNSLSNSESNSVSSSQSVSEGHTQGISFGESTGSNLGTNQGVSHSDGFSQGISSGESFGTGNSIGQSNSEGSSYGTSYGQSQSASSSQGSSMSNSSSTSSSHSTSSGIAHSSGSSWSSGSTNSASSGWNSGSSINAGISQGASDSRGNGNASSDSTSSSHSNTLNGSVNLFGFSLGGSDTVGESQAHSDSTSQTLGHSDSNGSNLSQGRSNGLNGSWSSTTSSSSGGSSGTTTSSSSSNTSGTSNGISYGTTRGISNGVSNSVGQSFGTTLGYSNSISSSNNHAVNFGNSAGLTSGDGSSAGISQGISRGNSTSVSSSTSQSVSQGQSQGYSTGTSVGQSQGVSQGTSASTSQGQSQGTSKGYGESTGLGTTGASNIGASASMGIAPSIGISKSHMWLDQQVKDILEVLEYKNERLKLALRQGMYYTYCYILCESEAALNAAKAAAISAWQNDMALTQPVQTLNLSDWEQQHLLNHAYAFSADLTKEDFAGVEDYKYGTRLLPRELAALTHLPRVAEGGVFAETLDIPKFEVPASMQGDIYLGNILNSARYSFDTGYDTPYEYRLDESALMHTYIAGQSRSGKTVAAVRMVKELSNVIRKKTNKKLRIIVFDSKYDWRTLANFVEPSRFKFFSLGNTKFRPIKLNIWKVPKGVYVQTWVDTIIDTFCRSYGLLERGKLILAEAIYSEYEKAGVIQAMNDENIIDEETRSDIISQRSSKVSFCGIYNSFNNKLKEVQNKSSSKKYDNATIEAFSRLTERLSGFGRSFSIETQLFGREDGMGIEELLGDDDITVLESAGIGDNTFRNFIFGVITSGIFEFARVQEKGFLSRDQYETVLVVEEANEILIGNDTAVSGSGGGASLSGASKFETMLNQSAGLGLFIMALTQTISKMPSAMIANAGIQLVGRSNVRDDIDVAAMAIGKETRMDDRDFLKFLPRMPIGWFVAKSARGFDFKEASPVLVKIKPLDVDEISNEELDEFLLRGEIARAELAKKGFKDKKII